MLAAKAALKRDSMYREQEGRRAVVALGGRGDLATSGRATLPRSARSPLSLFCNQSCKASHRNRSVYTTSPRSPLLRPSLPLPPFPSHLLLDLDLALLLSPTLLDVMISTISVLLPSHSGPAETQKLYQKYQTPDPLDDDDDDDEQHPHRTTTSDPSSSPADPRLPPLSSYSCSPRPAPFRRPHRAPPPPPRRPTSAGNRSSRSTRSTRTSHPAGPPPSTLSSLAEPLDARPRACRSARARRPHARLVAAPHLSPLSPSGARLSLPARLPMRRTCPPARRRGNPRAHLGVRRRLHKLQSLARRRTHPALALSPPSSRALAAPLEPHHALAHLCTPLCQLSSSSPSSRPSRSPRSPARSSAFLLSGLSNAHEHEHGLLHKRRGESTRETLPRRAHGPHQGWEEGRREGSARRRRPYYAHAAPRRRHRAPSVERARPPERLDSSAHSKLARTLTAPRRARSRLRLSRRRRPRLAAVTVPTRRRRRRGERGRGTRRGRARGGGRLRVERGRERGAAMDRERGERSGRGGEGEEGRGREAGEEAARASEARASGGRVWITSVAEEGPWPRASAAR